MKKIRVIGKYPPTLVPYDPRYQTQAGRKKIYSERVGLHCIGEEFNDNFLFDDITEYHHGCVRHGLRPDRLSMKPYIGFRKGGGFMGHFTGHFPETGGWKGLSYNKVADRLTEDEAFEKDNKRFFREITNSYKPFKGECAVCGDIGTQCHHQNPTASAIYQSCRNLITVADRNNYDWYTIATEWFYPDNHPSVIHFVQLIKSTAFSWLCFKHHIGTAHKRTIKQKPIVVADPIDIGDLLS